MSDDNDFDVWRSMIENEFKVSNEALFRGIIQDKLSEVSFRNSLIADPFEFKNDALINVKASGYDFTVSSEELGLASCTDNIIKNIHTKIVNQICEEEDNRILAMVGIDWAQGESISRVQEVVMPQLDGVTCSKCHDFNQYCVTPSETDGTHLCYKCRNGY